MDKGTHSSIRMKIQRCCNHIWIIFNCCLTIFFQELGLAFLPIGILWLISKLSGKAYSQFTIFNNLFIACLTLSISNIFFIFSERNAKGPKDNSIEKCAFCLSFISLIISFCAYFVTACEEIIPGQLLGGINPEKDYWKITIFILILIIIVELFKIAKMVKEWKK